MNRKQKRAALLILYNILELFFNDYVTLKSGVKADANSDSHH